METIFVNSYTRMEKIPLSEISKIDFAMCKSPRETLSSYYKRQSVKPDILINGGLFCMKNGETIFDFKDEDVVVAHDGSQPYGFGNTLTSKIKYGHRHDPNFIDFISGYPCLLIDGVKTTNFPKNLEGKHPRTAIGYNETHFFILICDGRASKKFGATFPQLQDWFLSVGCTHAIGLDGGGSTRELISGEVVNSPTENRAVDNVVAVYLKGGEQVEHKVYISPSTQEANGNSNYSYVEETEMNLIADILVKELTFNGISVKRNKPTMTVQEVVVDSNAYKPEFHLAIHSNAHGTNTPAGDKTARGAVAFICGKGGKAEKYAIEICKFLNKIQPFQNRGKNSILVNTALYETRKTNSPAVIIEVDYHDNEGALWVQQNREKIAVNLCMAILSQLGLPYTKMENTTEGIPPRQWFSEAQEWVIKNNISDGKRPNETVTRAESWQMLYNYKKNI